MFIGRNSTAFGNHSQPHSVGNFDYGRTMFKKDTKAVLWENIQALMDVDFGGEKLGKFSAKCGIGAASMTRIKQCETDVTISTLEKMARPYGLEPWQLLTEGMGKKNSEWPFSTVTQAQFESLEATDRAAIEGYIDARIGIARDKLNTKAAA